MVERLHRLLLRLYRRMPTWARRRLVRAIAPSYTVGAMCFIERPGGELLLVRLAYRQHWGVPGGLVQRGEETDDAARREVFEEVGLPVDLVGEPVVVVESEPQRVDVIYRAEVADGADPDSAHPCSPEIVAVSWFRRDALPDLQHETALALVALDRRTVREVRLAEGA